VEDADLSRLKLTYFTTKGGEPGINLSCGGLPIRVLITGCVIVGSVRPSKIDENKLEQCIRIKNPDVLEALRTIDSMHFLDDSVDPITKSTGLFGEDSDLLMLRIDPTCRTFTEDGKPTTLDATNYSGHYCRLAVWPRIWKLDPKEGYTSTRYGISYRLMQAKVLNETDTPPSADAMDDAIYV
jgi:hypothetical protein